jgi:hypothetical protein
MIQQEKVDEREKMMEIAQKKEEKKNIVVEEFKMET